LKVIKDQIIASTHVDGTGGQFSKKDLQYFFSQIPDEYEFNQDHDLSKPVVAKGRDKKFAKLPDGHHAITMDIEVYDENIFEKMGGISISFTKGRITVNEKKRGDIEIIFNASIFNREDIEDLVDLSTSYVQIDGLELVQKALEPIGIIIISFVGTAFFNGFFGKAGSDLYDSLKKKLREVSKKQNKEKNTNVNFHGKINLKIDSKIVELIIPFNSDQLDIIDKHGICLDEIKKDIENNIESYKSNRITVAIIDESPYWHITNLY